MSKSKSCKANALIFEKAHNSAYNRGMAFHYPNCLKKCSALYLTSAAVFLACQVLRPAPAECRTINVEGYPNVMDNAIEHNRQGTHLMKLERYLEAAEEFQAAIRLNPYAAMSGSLYNNLGTAYLHLEQYPLAIASFHYALRIQPDNDMYYRNLIRAYVVSGAIPLAQMELQSITLGNADNAEAFYLLGLIYEEQDNYALAQACFERFKKIKPYSPLSATIK